MLIRTKINQALIIGPHQKFINNNNNYLISSSDSLTSKLNSGGKNKCIMLGDKNKLNCWRLMDITTIIIIIKNLKVFYFLEKVNVLSRDIGATLSYSYIENTRGWACNRAARLLYNYPCCAWPQPSFCTSQPPGSSRRCNRKCVRELHALDQQLFIILLFLYFI